MLIYWFIWLCINVLNFLSSNKITFKVLYIFTLFILCLFVGLRFEVGVDREDYLKLHDYMGQLNFKDALTYTDPGYAFLNYFSNYLNFNDLMFVNFICSLIVFISFYIFSTKFKYFFVPLVVAYTYFIVVVSMNYVRQSVSISLIFLGIAFLLNKNNIKFIICLFLASLFHKTAAVFVVLLPLFYITKIYFSKIVSLIYILFSLIFITFILYLSSISESNIYVSQGEISSAGAVFRSMFHVVPVFLYIYFRNFFKKQYSDSILILDYILLLVVYCFVLSFLFSTLSDRFNLYLIFFDILVYAKLCEKLSLFARNLIFLYLFLFYSVVFYIWFNWGEWAEYGWLPYKNYIYEFLLNTF